jgi:hypothetical protein
MGKSAVQVGMEKKDRMKGKTPAEYKAYCAFRAMLWDAIDNKKNISIVELSKQLGLSK